MTNSHARTSKAKPQKGYSNAHRTVKRNIEAEKMNYIKWLSRGSRGSGEKWEHEAAI